MLDKAAKIGVSGPFATGDAALARVGVGSLRMGPVAGRGRPPARTPAGGHPAGAAMVADDLASGVLVELRLSDRVPFDYAVDAIHRNDTPPGPAARWLIERFRMQGS